VGSMDLRSVLLELHTALRSAAIEHALIGGLAMAAHGAARATVDLDFLVDGARADDADALLRTHGYAVLHRSEHAANYVSEDPARGRVDFLFARRAHAHAMLARAGLHVALGQSLRVVDAADLIGLKVQASSNDPSRRRRDLADIERLLQVGEPDLSRVREYFRLFDRELAAYFGVPNETGVVVSSVTPRSPAAAAGIQPGDVLTDFAGNAIEAEKEEDLGNFQRVVARVAPGESASIALRRGGARKQVRVTLVEAPRAEAEELESETGFHAQEITETIVRQNRLARRRGAYVSFVASGSPAAEAGLEPGDVIRRVEGRDVENLGELRKELAEAEKLPRFLVTAERGEETRLVLLRRGARKNSADEPNGDAGEASQP